MSEKEKKKAIIIDDAGLFLARLKSGEPASAKATDPIRNYYLRLICVELHELNGFLRLYKKAMFYGWHTLREEQEKQETTSQ